jgi:signal transduction histidine kinase
MEQEALAPVVTAVTSSSIEQYQRALKLLLQAVCDLSLARDIETVQSIVRTAARALNGADGATFVLRDGNLCFYADEDAVSPLWKGQRFPMRSCISGWAMLNRRPASIPDIYEDPRIPVDAYRPTFVKSLVMVPIRKENPIGAIGNYWASHHQPTGQEIELIQALADSTAIAIENVQLYQQLEHRVELRTAQLQAANRELESFSYSVSHDLHAPLRQIDNLTEILIQEHGDSLNPESTRLVSHIADSAKRSRHLIDDLLDFARMGAQKIVPAEIDMAAMAQTVFAELTENSEKSVQAAFESLPTAFGDASLLRQVWSNLLSNAIKYSSKREKPRLAVAGVVTDHECIFSVSDNGAGFDPSHAQQLFGVFRRLHSASEFPGTGVGLSIVRRIVVRHGGRVWAESELDKGATFYFALPRAPEDALAAT